MPQGGSLVSATSSAPLVVVPLVTPASGSGAAAQFAGGVAGSSAVTITWNDSTGKQQVSTFTVTVSDT
jgi:hypothetical protein